MKNLFILLFIVSSYSFGQETCKDSIFYIKPLNKLINFTKNRTVIEFNYSLSESLRKTIFNYSNFSEKEKRVVIETLSNNTDYFPCNKISKIVSTLEHRPLNADGTFMLWKYSKPVYVSDNKVIVFYEILLKKESYSGVGGGSNVVQIYEKQGGLWKLVDRKTLEYY